MDGVKSTLEGVSRVYLSVTVENEVLEKAMVQRRKNLTTVLLGCVTSSGVTFPKHGLHQRSKLNF